MRLAKVFDGFSGLQSRWKEIVKADRRQHTFGYGPVSCDMRRMARVMESLMIEGQTMPIVFVRYNPNAYSVDGARVKTPKRDREASLVSMLSSPKSVIFTGQPLVIQYMYYDVSNATLDVLKDHEYHADFAACCLQAIV